MDPPSGSSSRVTPQPRRRVAQLPGGRQLADSDTSSITPDVNDDNDNEVTYITEKHSDHKMRYSHLDDQGIEMVYIGPRIIKAPSIELDSDSDNSDKDPVPSFSASPSASTHIQTRGRRMSSRACARTSTAPDGPSTSAAASARDAQSTSTLGPSQEDEANIICSICRIVRDRGLVRLVECGHKFHRHCVCEWLSRKKRGGQNCPNCRQPPTEIRRLIGGGRVKIPSPVPESAASDSDEMLEGMDGDSEDSVSDEDDPALELALALSRTEATRRTSRTNVMRLLDSPEGDEGANEAATATTSASSAESRRMNMRRALGLSDRGDSHSSDRAASYLSAISAEYRRINMRITLGLRDRRDYQISDGASASAASSPGSRRQLGRVRLHDDEQGQEAASRGRGRPQSRDNAGAEVVSDEEETPPSPPQHSAMARRMRTRAQRRIIQGSGEAAETSTSGLQGLGDTSEEETSEAPGDGRGELELRSCRSNPANRAEDGNDEELMDESREHAPSPARSVSGVDADDEGYIPARYTRRRVPRRLRAIKNDEDSSESDEEDDLAKRRALMNRTMGAQERPDGEKEASEHENPEDEGSIAKKPRHDEEGGHQKEMERGEPEGDEEEKSTEEYKGDDSEKSSEEMNGEEMESEEDEVEEEEKGKGASENSRDGKEGPGSVSVSLPSSMDSIPATSPAIFGTLPDTDYCAAGGFLIPFDASTSAYEVRHRSISEIFEEVKKRILGINQFEQQPSSSAADASSLPTLSSASPKSHRSAIAQISGDNDEHPVKKKSRLTADHLFEEKPSPSSVDNASFPNFSTSSAPLVDAATQTTSRSSTPSSPSPDATVSRGEFNELVKELNALKRRLNTIENRERGNRGQTSLSSPSS